MEWHATQRDRLVSLFGAYYPPETVRAILGLIRPALRLGGAGSRPGLSRLGGPPMLPAGLSRPDWKGRPLDFLAVIDFAEMASAQSLPELPGTGMVCFYYAAEIPRPWGDDPADRDGWRVLCVPDRSASEGREPPVPVAEDGESPVLVAGGWASRTPVTGGGEPPVPVAEEGESPVLVAGGWASRTPVTGGGEPPAPVAGKGASRAPQTSPSLALAAEPFLSLPGPYEPSVRVLDATWPGFLDVYEQLYAAWLRFVWADRPRHQLAGWPVLVQRSLGEDQRLLLQLDSDERLGRCWGDPGTVYFHARPDDLRSFALDRCQLTLQAR